MHTGAKLNKTQTIPFYLICIDFISLQFFVFLNFDLHKIRFEIEDYYVSSTCNPVIYVHCTDTENG